MKNISQLAFLGLAALAAACSSSSDSGADGQGTVAFTTFGEDYIMKEIPAADVEDGYTIKYEKFLVVISDITVQDGAAGPVAAKMNEPKIFDMHTAGERPVVTFSNVPGKAYTHVSYRIAPATAAAVVGPNTTEADKTLMTTNGYSIYAEGTVSKDAVSKKFKWGFKLNTLYDRCEGEIGGKKTEGVVVTNGGTDTAQLTIHGDHLWYDDLQAAEAKVRAQNIVAADKNNDGEVTLEELAAVKLIDIPKGQGTYGTGSAAGINDLRAFVEALSRTVGHFRGEGECFASAK
ncbi:MAG: hypothetical protein JST00_08155 [Deltaproteobacteria bacterium]|nr:hypothetical protein [Deltaproteobacteria bacterium]